MRFYVSFILGLHLLALLLTLVIVTCGCRKPMKPIDYDAEAQAVPEENFTNSVGMQMIRLSSGYWVSAHEVTEEQYAVFAKPPTGHVRNAPRFPVRSVSAEQAIEFCRKLTEKERAEGVLPAGYVYSLPTERQWRTAAADARLEDAVMPTREIEYPAGEVERLKKAGYRVQTQEMFDFPCEVGSRGPNRLGLYDTRGNVAEWCLERFSPKSGVYTSRVIRGGSYLRSDPAYWLVDHRAGLAGSDSGDVGFRAVLTSDGVSPGNSAGTQQP